MHWVWLGLAIAAEVIGTTALKAADGFAKPVPSMVTVVAYGASFYWLGLALKVVPVGVAYALWSGAGIVMIALIGFVMFGQRLDAAALAGIGLILAGVIVINTLSTSVPH
ncbi:MAG: multidrug efflux SMR transporter [Pseudomonadota bacterium]